MVVDMNLRSGRASLILHLFFLVLGIAALQTPNAQQTLTRGLFALGFILVAGANVRAIGLNQIDRVRMRRGPNA